MIKCFWLEPTNRVRIYLRRYVGHDDDDKCAVAEGGYHHAEAYIGERPAIYVDHSTGHRSLGEQTHLLEDPRWPTHCLCGHEFRGEHHVRQGLIYKRADTGEELELREAPVGAMWDAWWFRDAGGWRGEDGLSLTVKTPGGEWLIDGPANNCTMPDDRGQHRHHCWIRHGTPPNITVDKDGKTCAAGAGSIVAGSYHGFLRDGHLTPA